MIGSVLTLSGLLLRVDDFRGLVRSFKGNFEIDSNCFIANRLVANFVVLLAIVNGLIDPAPNFICRLLRKDALKWVPAIS